MGREIRRVPAGWEHPRHESGRNAGGFRPLYDEPFAEAMREWVDGWESWERGERPEYFRPESYPDGVEYWEYVGGPPDPEYYMPEWSAEEATHFQFYEDVSEGTPLSPPLPSLEALAEWLASNVDYCGQGPRTKEQAEAFCRAGWAPSFVMYGGRVTSGVEAMADMENTEEAGS